MEKKESRETGGYLYCSLGNLHVTKWPPIGQSFLFLCRTHEKFVQASEHNIPMENI